MTTFDNWEVAVHPPEDYLMHFRTPGSKNGVRRYQTESGEWTPLGLKERREREGWGEGGSKAERKAQKRVAKAEKNLAKSEKRAAKKAAKAEKKFERSERKRKRTLSGLTDEEMKKKLERAKMEAEYRDLTKRGSLIETGSKLVGKYIDYKNKKEERVIEANRQKIDFERAKAQQIQAKAQAKQAVADKIKAKHSGQVSRYEFKKAKQNRKQTEADAKAGLKYKRKAELVNAKKEYKAEKRSALGTWLKNKANKDKETRANDQEYRMQRAKNEFAATTGKNNAEKAKYDADKSRYEVEKSRHESSTAASNARQAETERKWRETQAKVTASQAEENKKKKKK